MAFTYDILDKAINRTSRLHLPYNDQPPQCVACARGEECDDRTLIRASTLFLKILSVLGAK